MNPDDEAFARRVATRLGRLPRVVAVALGGSRATETHREDSDWDFAVYYRGPFDPADLRATGWPGEVSPIGGWGGGVFNGGAWLRIEGRQVDVHYRDLDDVERCIDDATAGRYAVEPLLFHLAGIPTYIVVAELAQNRVLSGELPRPGYPPALRRTAPTRWWDAARANLDYARTAHAAHGHVVDCAGAIALATCQASHAVLAARGEWATNEKTLIDRAGLREVNRVLADLDPSPAGLAAAIDRALTILEAAVGEARRSVPEGTPAV